ncbi:formate dehydrogenase subunit gamma [Allorhizobium undicola]|uniref:formate dehydrogenase subunit gamma n=1 Tax=Allorhizobium undicola TaxID=78527 RepID=UPI003D352294
MTLHTMAAIDAARIEAIVAEHAGFEGPLLPILHSIQREFGHIPEMAKEMIARALNLSRAEVHGVVTFYHDFRARPAGRHVLKLCRAEACQAMHGDALAEGIKALLGIDWHETTSDGAVTLEPVFCLGLCAQAPAAMLDGEVHARLDEHCLTGLLREVCR